MDWNELLMMLLKVALLLAVVCVGGALTAWLKKLKDKAEATAGNEYQAIKSAYLDEAENIVQTAVDMVQQTLVDDIKGTELWTDETKEEAFAEAIKTVSDILGEDGLTALEGMFGDASAWITAKIEQAVLSGKEAKAQKISTEETEEGGENDEICGSVR